MTAIPTKRLAGGYQLPVLGLGTWTVGGARERDSATDIDGEVASLKRGIDAGVTHLDTAELYADGFAEEILGKAIAGYDRTKLQLVSKAFPAKLPGSSVRQRLEGSLQRLATDYLDVYLLHVYPHEYGLAKALAEMDELVAEGLIRQIGVSDFNVSQLREAQSLATHPIVMNQVHYNLQIREMEQRGVLEYCQQHDLFLNAWCPLQRAGLVNDVPAVMAEIATKYDKTPAQVAINWLTSQVNVITIFKTSNPDHLKENLGAIGWELDSSDVERLRTEFPDQRPVSNVGPLDPD